MYVIWWFTVYKFTVHTIVYSKLLLIAAIVSGATEQVRQTQRPPDQCCDYRPFACRWEARVLSAYRSCPHKHHSLDLKESCGVRANFERRCHKFSPGVAWNMIRLNTKQNSNQACVRCSFMSFSWCLKPPMDTYLVNQNLVILPRPKQRLVVMFGPQNLRSHLIALTFKKFSWGSMPPDPPSFYVQASLRTRL